MSLHLFKNALLLYELAKKYKETKFDELVL